MIKLDTTCELLQTWWQYCVEAYAISLYVKWLVTHRSYNGYNMILPTSIYEFFFERIVMFGGLSMVLLVFSMFIVSVGFVELVIFSAGPSVPVYRAYVKHPLTMSYG